MAEAKDSKSKPKKENYKKKFEDLQNDHLRLRADFDNYRKRKEQELVESREKAVTNFVSDILPVIDNFEMSLKMSDNKDMFVKGVEMIHKNLLDTLKENKIEHFEPKLNDPFDPTHHDPVVIEDEKAQAGKVLGVVRKGYKSKDKVIRAARVQVKKEKDN